MMISPLFVYAEIANTERILPAMTMCASFGRLKMNTKREKQTKPKIELDDDLFGAVLNCAVRYAMGRQSYMPSLVVDFITPLLPYITQKTLGVFKQDYEINQRTADENGWAMFGDTKIDKPLWDKFYADVCAEIEKRNDKVIT